MKDLRQTLFNIETNIIEMQALSTEMNGILKTLDGCEDWYFNEYLKPTVLLCINLTNTITNSALAFSAVINSKINS